MLVIKHGFSKKNHEWRGYLTIVNIASVGDEIDLVECRIISYSFA